MTFLNMYQAPCSTNEEELLSSLSEMFSDIDPGVVYMVLSESDFKVDVAMDYLLELSTAAKEPLTQCTAGGTGFDLLAASLDGGEQPCIVGWSDVSENEGAQLGSLGDSDLSPNTLLTQDFDSLIEHEFEKCGLTYTLPSDLKGKCLEPLDCLSEIHEIPGLLSTRVHFDDTQEHEFEKCSLTYTLPSDLNSKCPEPLDCLSEIHEIPGLLSTRVNFDDTQEHKGGYVCFSSGVTQDDCAPTQLESIKWSVQANDGTSVHEDNSLGEFEMNSGTGRVSGTIGSSEHMQSEKFDRAHLNKQQSSNSQDILFRGQHCEGSLQPTQKIQSVLEKSAAQGLNALDNVVVSSELENSFVVPTLVPEDPSVENTKLAHADESNMETNPQISSCLQTVWNPLACEFYPPNYPSFITPVAFTPVHWTPPLDQRTFVKGFQFSPVSSTAWNSNSFSAKVQGPKPENAKLLPVTQSSGLHVVKKKQRLLGKVLLLLRGVPGSGKTTLARTLLEQNPGGIILCTDDFFCRNGQYHFDPSLLEEAHALKQKQAKEAFKKNISPIIIDNTNIHAWEMKPYVAMALQHKFTVVFREPDTWWKYKPKELERRNIHGITKERIRKMLNRFERNVSVNSIMNSACKKQERSDMDQDFDEESDSQTSACAKESTPQYSPFPYCTLNRKEKPILQMDSSLFLETNEEDTSKTQKDMENEKGDTTAEKDIAQEDCTMCSTRDNFEGQKTSLESQDLKEKARTNIIVATDSMKCVELEVARRSETCDTLLLECTTKNDMVHEQFLAVNENSSQEVPNVALPPSLRPELLNFVGDWPVEKSMSQRTQRIRKIEKAPSKQNYGEVRNASPHPVQSSTQECSESVGGKTDVPEKALQHTFRNEVGSQDGCGSEIKSLPISFAIQLDDTTVGDLPDTLNLSPGQRGKLIADCFKKTDCESKSGDGLNASNMFRSEHPQSGSDNTGKQMGADTSPFQDDVAATSEIFIQKQNEQSRKAGKQRKLALTFNNESSNVSDLSLLPSTSPQKDVPLRNHCTSSQTEPQEFALLWRIERKKSNVTEFTKVLIGKVDQFVSANTVVVAEAESSEEIPYRVMHDKSTSVEESELIEQDESENLSALCMMFRSVSFDVLKDLYERCNKDIGWATNLLLDSGEKLYKEEDAENSGAVDALEQPDFESNLTLTNTDNKEKLKILEENNTISQSILENDHKKSHDQAAVEIISLLDSNIKENPEILQETNPNVATSECRKQSEELDLALSQSLSPTIYGMNPPHNLMHSNFKEATRKKNIQSSLFANSPETHMYIEDVDGQKYHPSFVKLDMQERDKIHFPSFSNKFSSSWKADLNEKLASDYLESEINIQFREDYYETFLDQQNSQMIGVNSKSQNPELKQHIHRPTDVSIDEAIKTVLQEPRMHSQDAKLALSEPINIESLQFSLPPELAFQLSELFGPVGIDLGSLTVEDCMVHIDLSLAKVIHEKWKESITERQRQETLSYQLIMEDEQFWANTMELPPLPRPAESSRLEKQEIMSDSASDLVWSERSQGSVQQQNDLPFMDHWNSPPQKVSLRKIMSEEVAFQEQHDLKHVSPKHRKDGAAIVKEKQLFQMFPNIDQKLLLDIFQESNFSLEKTESFFKNMLEADPVQNVVAPEIVPQSILIQSYKAANSKEKRKKTKTDEEELCAKSFQDFEDPEYADFRTESFLHRSKQQECFRKAAEAYRRGMKEVATFYAQQGHLHGYKMKEANRMAALQIFNQVNESLLPENVLDLHGLHVDEAIKHMRQILQEKTEEHKHAGGKPYLSVITGRGNHSQGGVARIKPAVIEYLNKHNFNFKEIKPGCLQVMLK